MYTIANLSVTLHGMVYLEKTSLPINVLIGNGRFLCSSFKEIKKRYQKTPTDWL